MRRMTLQELRHELVCPRSTWQAVNPDGVLACGQLLLCQEAHRHQLVANELAATAQQRMACAGWTSCPQGRRRGSGQDRAVCSIRTV